MLRWKTVDGKINPDVIITNDFDLAMSKLAHNHYQLFAMEQERYSYLTIQILQDKIVLNGVDTIIRENTISAQIK